MMPSMFTSNTLNTRQVLAAFREYKTFGLTLDQAEFEFLKWHGPLTQEIKQLALKIYGDVSIRDESLKSVVRGGTQEQDKVTNEFHESIWIVE